MKMNNQRDKKQLEYWNNIYMFISASVQIQEDFLQIDRNRDAARQEQLNREKWLLDNWNIGRPNRKVLKRRKPFSTL